MLIICQKKSYHQRSNKYVNLNKQLFESPKILWEEKAYTFLHENDLPTIPGAWKLFLLGDGSPTRHLQLLANKETKISLIGMDTDTSKTNEAPQEIIQLEKPLIRRQVWIRSNDTTFAWAESWWNTQQVNINLTDKKEPIWKNLT